MGEEYLCVYVISIMYEVSIFIYTSMSSIMNGTCISSINGVGDLRRGPIEK